MLRQASLLDADAPVGLSTLAPKRLTLAAAAWVDHQPRWLTGSDALFDELAATVDWRDEERQMYNNVVAVPRLTRFYSADEPLPHAALNEAKDRLSRHYAAELGEPFVTLGLCLYRDGRDSVAWHGDRIGRSATQDTMVAILSIGAARTLALRPRGGGPTALRLALGHGDLVVMGGSCQRTWEHAVPKTAAAVGPRISIQFRTRGVR